MKIAAEAAEVSPRESRPAPSTAATRVVLFCGGRGSSTIIRELIRWPQVELSLLVNAYDDGLSTGALRRFIPDMLGPSDFRKNLSTLLDLHSNEQYALQHLLEYRLPAGFGEQEALQLAQFVRTGEGLASLPGKLPELFGGLGARLRDRLSGYLVRFFDYHGQSAGKLDFVDCSLGNLVFAGAFLESNCNFNASVRSLAGICGAQAELVNVTNGEARTLVALKQDGEVLECEARIVGPQSDAPIEGIYFLEHGLSGAQLEQLQSAPPGTRRELLRGWERPVTLSKDAAEALRSADVIVYGPGTQFSSLLPSYRTIGFADAVRANRTAPKVYVSNLDADHDIQSLSLTDLVDKALELMGDAENTAGLITHILYNSASAGRVHPGNVGPDDCYKGAQIVRDDFQNPVKSTVHSGYAVVKQLFAIRDARLDRRRKESLDIYIDLLERSRSTESTLQEFLEVPWQQSFRNVRLLINRMDRPASLNLPEHMQVEGSANSGLFSEVDALVNWLRHSDSLYLLTVAGDGEYRLRDAWLGVEALKSGTFGVVFGSRMQSRAQFHSSLRSAYGESQALFWLSWFAGYVFSFAVGVVCRSIFSDPLTGFRLYKRSRLPKEFVDSLERERPRSAVEVTKRLVRAGVEIAEVPVTYRTFAGFTRPKWRFERAVRNLSGLLS
jgi:2-phospho-L-lactate transferase/gluconeogenesis factor (CofD/UPF0052 family)